MNRLLVTVIGLMMLASCVSEVKTKQMDAAQASGVTEKPVTVCFRCSDPYTRSSIDAGEEDISELRIFAYCDGDLAGSAYSADGSSVYMELQAHRNYNVYAIANSGNIPECKDEETFIARPISFSSWTGVSGIPMSASMNVDIDDVSGVIDLNLERLAARFSLKIERCFSQSSFTVSSAVIRQSASQIYPFSAESRSSAYADGDYADSQDITSLNATGAVDFYVPENRQGILLPGNTDPWAKVPSSIPAKSDACTYLEINGEWYDRGISAPLTYRLYLGEDNCTDFNIIRNTVRNIVLNLTDSGVSASSWKVEKGEETDHRSMSFSPDNLVLIPDGRVCVSTVILNPSDAQYELDYDASDFASSGVTLQQSGNKLKISANENLSADKNLTVMLKTAQGDIRDVLDLVVRHVGISAPYGVRIGTQQSCDIAVDVVPAVSETGWQVKYSSADKNVAVISRVNESGCKGNSTVSAAGSGETVLYASYGPCTASMETLVEQQDGFYYSGLSGYISGGTIMNATVSPHLADNLFSPIRLESNSDETVLKVTRTATSNVFLQRYQNYAPDYGNIWGASEFQIEPVGPGVAYLAFRSDYPYCVQSRVITVVSETGYYLNETCKNTSTGVTLSKGPANTPATFMFTASNEDILELKFTPDVKGAFISDVSVKTLYKRGSHTGWTDEDYYSLSMVGKHLNDCVWHLKGRDCKVEIQVTFGKNQQTVVSTYTFS